MKVFSIPAVAFRFGHSHVVNFTAMFIVYVRDLRSTFSFHSYFRGLGLDAGLTPRSDPDNDPVFH